MFVWVIFWTLNLMQHVSHTVINICKWCIALSCAVAAAVAVTVTTAMIAMTTDTSGDESSNYDPLLLLWLYCSDFVGGLPIRHLQITEWTRWCCNVKNAKVDRLHLTKHQANGLRFVAPSAVNPGKNSYNNNLICSEITVRWPHFCRTISCNRLTGYQDNGLGLEFGVRYCLLVW